MQRTSSGAGGRLLLDALCFPTPDLFPIHNSISWCAAPWKRFRLTTRAAN
jgi:hypothetical protein